MAQMKGKGTTKPTKSQDAQMMKPSAKMDEMKKLNSMHNGSMAYDHKKGMMVKAPKQKMSMKPSEC